ncbi:MAG: CoA transferase [Syntrophales bacterium]|jgi:crotonobetainyl-CoA:carnitine CoA-transferase CaiB-like acyl-CoA transferase|nr:CoA transferase [Syntrophales bacterium]MDY0045348.1 CoA transferase [Syntrophales bacterium]
MKEETKKTQAYSRHLISKEASEHLDNFNALLSEMMASAEGKPEALNGVTVVEVGQANYPGIISSCMLAEFGAEVIKVEPPEGDPARKISQYGVNVNGDGIPFLMESRNKNFITLDLKTEKGRANFKKLIGKADVLIDAMRPGFMDELGIGYRQLHQMHAGLIYLAISPYGHFTKKGKEFRNIPDTDLTAQAEAGYPALIGDPEKPEPRNYPLKAGVWAAAYMSAGLAVAGTLTALFFKQRTGEGQMVDVPTYDAISTWQGFSHVWGFTFEMPRVRVGNFDWCLFPYGYYETQDGYVSVAAAADADFRGLLKLLGRWDLENDWRFLYDRITDNVEKLKELEAEIKKKLAKIKSRELVKKALDYSSKAAKDPIRGKGFPIIVETLLPRQVLEEDHWKIRNAFVKVDVEKDGTLQYPSSVPKMSVSPPRVKKINCGIGVDNEKIYTKYGLDK